MLYGTFCDTPIGRRAILCTHAGLYAIKRLDELPCAENRTPIVRQTEEQLHEYFAGVRRKFDVPLDPQRGTEFQKRVWAAVMQIPYGQTRSYGEVAASIGRARAARAVGSAMAKTPFSIVVPCHRVIKAGGSVGGYGGEQACIGEKEFLLAMEKRVLQSDMNRPYVLFDLDGTLTDPKEGITKCVQYALADFGISEPDLEALTCFIGPPLSESFQDYYGFDKMEAKQAVEKYRERFATVGLFENRVFDGVQEMLAQLKAAGKVICLATSKPTVFARKILEKYGLERYFDVVVGSELDGTRTDKAEVIEEVLRRCCIGDKRQLAVMVGDRRHDIEGAAKCQLESIGVTFGYANPGELEAAGATYIVHTVDQLCTLLLSL